VAKLREMCRYCPDVLAAVIGGGRSGTHYLIHCLSNHPQVHAPREEPWGSVFRRRYPGTIPRQLLLEYIYCARGYRAAVAKFNYGRVKDSKLWEPFIENEFRVIHLTRRNYVRRAVSSFIYKRDHVTHVYGESREPQPIAIAPSWMLDQCAKYEKKEREFRDRITRWGLRTLELEFEDLLWRGEGTESNRIPHGYARQICFFLDVEHKDLYQTDMARTTGSPIHEVVKNWDAVKEAVAASDYAYCLEGIDG